MISVSDTSGMPEGSENVFWLAVNIPDDYDYIESFDIGLFSRTGIRPPRLVWKCMMGLQNGGGWQPLSNAPPFDTFQGVYFYDIKRAFLDEETREITDNEGLFEAYVEVAGKAIWRSHKLEGLPVMGDWVDPHDVYEYANRHEGIHATTNLDEVLATLNELVIADPEGMHALCETRVPFNGEHPTAQFSLNPEDGCIKLGLLGVLNALFGKSTTGWGAITAVFDEVEGYDDHRLTGFQRTDEKYLSPKEDDDS